MLAPRELPDQYRHWNLVHGAPHGYTRKRLEILKKFIPPKVWEQLRGPFSIQGNNPTRVFEYPWAYDSASLKPGMRILEIGGGLSGFQFVLSKIGCNVVNVDPGMDKLGWPCNQESMNTLNRRFKTNVELRNTTVSESNLEEESYDRAFSISVIEHLSDAEILEVIKHTYRSLKTGGLFIMTIDLFLNLSPFTQLDSNEFGKNRNVRWIIEQSSFEISLGNRNELFGFPEFNHEQIQSELEKYMIGYYPVLTQCLVLRKM